MTESSKRNNMQQHHMNNLRNLEANNHHSFSNNSHSQQHQHQHNIRKFEGNGLDEHLLEEEEEEEEIYVVKQRYGYLAILFSISQILVLIGMMWQCSIAPLNINPMVGPYPDALSYWGGKNAILIVDDGEYWRLLTPIFLHAGIIHLFCNISVQLETGAFFEREWGSLVWLIVYLTSAVGSSIMSCIFMPDTVGVGSSGAVMGLFGAKLSEVFCLACEKRLTKQEEIAHKVRMDECSGVMCSVILVMAMSFIPYVDWAAHLGGLVAGQLVGLILFSTFIRNRFFKVWWLTVGVIATVAAFSIAMEHMLNDIQPKEELRDVCEYYRQYFEDYECHCQLNENGNNNGDDSGDNRF